MTEHELVEKMARAIYDILEGSVANQDYTRQLRQWERAQDMARAALSVIREALKEPSEEIADAIVEAAQIYDEWGVDKFVANPKDVYRAMIAASPIGEK